MGRVYPDQMVAFKIKSNSAVGNRIQTSVVLNIPLTVRLVIKQVLWERISKLIGN